MVVAVLTVDMLMGNLFRGGRTHVNHTNGDAQGLASQRMVAIQVHHGALDFDHVKCVVLAIFPTTLQLTSNFHAWREILLVNGCQQGFVTLAERVRGCQRQGCLKTGLLAIQCGFDFGECVLVATVEVDRGVVAVVNQLAGGVRNLDAQGDGGVFLNFHGLSGWVLNCNVGLRFLIAIFAGFHTRTGAMDST